MSTISQDIRAVPKATVSSIIEKLPLTRTHYMLAIATALGYMFDAFDTYIVAWPAHTDSGQTSSLLMIDD